MRLPRCSESTRQFLDASRAAEKRYHLLRVMKEQDVRQRIEGFLKRTARELIIPASVGLSLGLSGCGSDAVFEYGAQFPPPDAGTYADVPTYAPMYAGSFPPGVHAGACSGTWSEGDFLEPPDASADGDAGGTTPCCGDGTVDQGEQCDFGNLNGRCLDVLGNPVGYPENAGCQSFPASCNCPADTMVLCSTMCRIPPIPGG